MPPRMRVSFGHLWRPHGLLQKERGVGKTPRHPILFEPVFAVLCNPTPPGESILKEFFDFEENFFLKKMFCDERRERQKEEQRNKGMTGYLGPFQKPG